MRALLLSIFGNKVIQEGTLLVGANNLLNIERLHLVKVLLLREVIVFQLHIPCGWRLLVLLAFRPELVFDLSVVIQLVFKKLFGLLMRHRSV
jgi:hypothetical protein